MGPPDSTGPIRESDAIPQTYVANFGFGFGILLIPQKPIRQSEAEFVKYFVNFGFDFEFRFISQGRYGNLRPILKSTLLLLVLVLVFF